MINIISGRRRGRSVVNPVELRRLTAGDAVLLCDHDGPKPGVAEWAARLPTDPGRVMVVLDLARQDNPWTWTGVVDMLSGLGPIRLAVSGSGSGQQALAGWLAEQLRVEVLAPDGAVSPVPGGSTFVDNGCGGGCWRMFSPGQESSELANRFPSPPWAADLRRSAWTVGTHLVAEQVPAGLWLHRHPTAGRISAYAKTIGELPCRADVLTVVIGAPGEPGPDTAEVTELLAGLPVSVRSVVRLAPAGGQFESQEPGQRVADALGERVVSYSGLPTEQGVVAVGDDGEISWHPFASAVGYLPAGQPVVLDCRPPVAGLQQLASAVFRWSPGIVVEVVQSGLWVRHDTEPARAETVRSAPLDRMWAKMTVGAPGRSQSIELTKAAADLFDRLDPTTQRQARFVFPDPPPLPTATEPPPTEIEDRGPTVRLHIPPPPPHAPAEVVVESAPHAISSIQDRLTHEDPVESEAEPGLLEYLGDTVDPAHRSTPQERDWLRRTLGPRFAAYSGSVLSVLSKQPGLRAVEGEDLEAVVSDLVAVQVYLSANENKVDEALRSGQLDTLRPYAGCVVSGLHRLPSYHGPAVHGAVTNLGADRYRPGMILADPGFLSVVGSLDVAVDTKVEFLIWSCTGRRVVDLDGPADPTVPRVVFPPGTRFKVLAIVEGGKVLLTDVIGPDPVGGLTDRDRTVLGRLELALRDRAATRSVTLDEHGWAFGGLRHQVAVDELAASA